MQTVKYWIKRLSVITKYAFHFARVVLIRVFQTNRDRKNVIILEAANHQDSLEICKAAKERGFSVHIVAPTYKTRCIFYATAVFKADPFKNENWSIISDYAKQIKADGVLIAHKESLLPLAKYVADSVGAVSYNSIAVETSNSKRKMRHEMLRVGIATTLFYRRPDEIEQFPVVAKMSNQSGSNGARLIDGPHDLALHSEADLFEEYVKGPQFDVECISYNSVHFATCIVHEFYEKRKPYFPPSWHLFNPPIETIYLDKIREAVFRMITEMGVVHGASHTELRIDENGEVKILEYANRIGSSFGPLVRASTGYDPFTAIVDTMTGKCPKSVQSTKKALIKAFILDDDDDRLFAELKSLNSTCLLKMKRVRRAITKEVTYRGFYVALLDSPWRWYDLWRKYCGSDIDILLSNPLWEKRSLANN